MHRILNGCPSDLISNWQFNESSGDVLDVVSHYNGTISGATRMASTCPIGLGVANSQVENQGLVNFTNTNFQANYSLLDEASLTTTRLNIRPYEVEGIGVDNVPLDHQYWILNRYEKSGDWQADLTFTLSEDITLADQAAPFGFKLYGRAFNSDGDWTAIMNANAANAADNSITFPSISQSGQFLITRSNETILTTSVEEIGYCQVSANMNENIQTYFVGGNGLTEVVALTVSGNFEISLDSLSGYGAALSLNPVDGTVNLTKIYARPNAVAISSDIGQITHSSNGVTSKNVALSLKSIGTIASNLLDGEDGAYMTLPRNPDLLFGPSQDFTVELWIYTDASNSDPSIISNKNWASGGNVGWGLFYLNDDWKVNINGSGGSRVDLNSNAPAINDGNWHHLAVVFDRDDQLSIYQDGALTNQITMSGLNGRSIDAGFPINVLQDGTGIYGIPMNAKIDELRLWNTIRTGEQIQANMNITLSCLENGLVAYYQFNETTGECKDEFGGNHGTLMNGALRNPSDAPINLAEEEDCKGYRQLVEQISAGIYQFRAKDTLNSTATLMSGSQVDYRAGKMIILKPGFLAATGAQFLAKIEACIPDESLQQEVSIPNQRNTTLQNYSIKLSLNLERETITPEIVVFPNPVNEHLQIQIKSEVQEVAEISIQNSFGIILQQKKEYIQANYYQTSLQVADYAPGMYWVRIRFTETGNWQVVPIIKG